MINVTDRVSTEVLANGAIRYEEFNAQGVSQGYKYIKKADNPSNVGTPINKALFDSIKYDLEYPIQRFSSNIIPVFNQDTLSLSYSKSNIYGEWTISSNYHSSLGSDGVLTKAFRKNDSVINNLTNALKYTSNVDNTKTLEIIVESPKSIINPCISCTHRSFSGNPKIYGYNHDTSNWDELGSITTGGQGIIINARIEVNNNNKYDKFKFTGTGVSSTYTVLVYNISIESGYIVTGGTE